MPGIAQQDISYQPAAKGYSFSANSTSPKNTENKKNKGFALLLCEIIGLITLFIVFLLILNFFNIISLSTIYPKQMGFLPHLNQTINNAQKTNMKDQTANKNAPQPTIEYNTMTNTPMGSCPLAAGCQNTTPIGDNSNTSSNFSGLGFIVNGPQSVILAMREGEISLKNITENNENITVVTITDPAGIQEYVYKFNQSAYSPLINSGNVKEGQTIGEIKNPATITYQSKSYSFILDMYLLVSKQYLKLEPSADGKSLENPNR